GTPISDLPKTFRDAILVAKKCNIRYLWIDSLCIFQDNLEDWHVEAGHMREIYGGAACCIAVTAGENSSVGCFFDRDPQTSQPFLVEVSGSQHADDPGLPLPGTYWCSLNWISPFNAIESAPLNQRAWVAQERYLSRRVMHFANDALFWEC
ncbi:heterokaryon incompatibility, partial [Setomelanomma holmii]